MAGKPFRSSISAPRRSPFAPSVRAYRCFSGHADARDGRLARQRPRHATVTLVHGGPEELRTRAAQLVRQGWRNVRIARPGEAIEAGEIGEIRVVIDLSLSSLSFNRHLLIVVPRSTWRQSRNAGQARPLNDLPPSPSRFFDFGSQNLAFPRVFVDWPALHALDAATDAIGAARVVNGLPTTSLGRRKRGVWQLRCSIASRPSPDRKS